MFLEMLENIGTENGPYHRGQICDVPAALARDWTRAGHARQTDAMPPEIAALFARLDEGASSPCLFLPFVGEFGHQVMSHMRIVHFHKAAEKVVCCQPGEQVLFPSASSFCTDWKHPVPDFFRIGSQRNERFLFPAIEATYPGHHAIHAGGLTPVQEIFPIRPETRIPLRPTRRDLRADVVLGVRSRAFCMERNWPHWQAIAYALRAAGLTYAVIGRRDTSFDLEGQTCHSGDYDTSAAIELLQSCRLYVGQDSGNSHLAATVGAPMLLFRETRGGSRDLVDRMRVVNRQPINIVPGGWDKPELVIRCALAALGATA